ncbi:MAG: class I SAM-dependent DNA methyltransferase [Oscillospiraceae bacterium]|nr:class I SAM-dependent DNA methyltransferase [Oscillospiraceae bacterium]
MTDKEQKAAAKKFAQAWSGKGNEKQHTMLFWKELLEDVYGMPVTKETVQNEKEAVWDGKTFIDVYIPSTKVLIEQKSLGIDLDEREPRHGKMLTPFEQAKEYSDKLPTDETAKYIITCNFEIFRIYDMNRINPHRNYREIHLAELPEKLHMLDFIADRDKTPDDGNEAEISKDAGELVGQLKDALKARYKDPESESAKHSLTVLCVRLVFCLYAEDADVFPRHLQFHDYLKKYAKLSPNEVRKNLIELFKILNTPENERDDYLDEELAAFPYVNGGLFADESIEIPGFTEEITDILLRRASAGFDWSKINPTIFGAMFESVLSDDVRAGGGMHYTEPKNIHKVIDPLFLDDLKSELKGIIELKTVKTRNEKLERFQDKLAGLTFLDPASGSGNFLTLSYTELRRLENEVIAVLYGEGQLKDKDIFPVKVNISQFYGIEINDFAVSVAKTALWIAEHQMHRETEEILGQEFKFLPLKSYANITKANALRINWEDVVPKDRLSYIMGNPPFVGKKEQTKEQKNELTMVFRNDKTKVGNLDYVTAWFYKASCIININPHIKAAFVSTDSICQGEHVPNLWSVLVEKYNIQIIFAHRTFKWDNEAVDRAEVYCVIVGFASNIFKPSVYIIYEKENPQIVSHISAYLIDAPDVWLHSRPNQISNATKMSYGSMPIDNGALIVDEDVYEDIKKKEPSILKYIRSYAGAEELLKGKDRYCIWLKDASRKDIVNSPFLRKRVSECKSFRENSKRSATNKLAGTPELFGEIRQPTGKIIIVPKVSSKHRTYIPILYIDSDDYIINGSTLIIPSDDLFLFGILSSRVHNAWLRAIAETWGHSYQYSTDIYNNFPLPDSSTEDKNLIIQSANEILQTRHKHIDLTIADMYNPKLGVISDLSKAHKANDKAVMQAYGFKPDMTESDIVAELMKMYKALTEGAGK